MAFNPNNPNGSTTAANSAPVTVATDNNIAKETGGNLATVVTNTAAGVTRKITDGTNTAAVKAASTAAAATDPALVVAVSPNNTVPVSLATNTPTLQSGSTTAVTQATGTNLHTVVDSGTITTVTAVTGITNALPAGTNNLGNVNLLTRATGGATSFTLISAATTNATNVKASAGTLYGLYATNNGAAARYLKLYNLATAPTVGTSTPVMTLMIPAGGGITVPIPPQGINFSTGIAYALTGAITLADTTAVAASEVALNGIYA